MKKFINYYKKHWFSFSTIFLSLTLITTLIVSGIIIFNKQNNNVNVQDADLVYTLNSDIANIKGVNFQINTLHNYYNSLGYDLSNEKYKKTRQNLLKNIQEDYSTTRLFKNFLDKNNVPSENTKLLLDRYKTLKNGEDIYSNYLFYKQSIKEEALCYIIENNLIDVENEKNKIQQETNITNSALLYEIVLKNNQEKIFEILTQ